MPVTFPVQPGHGYRGVEGAVGPRAASENDSRLPPRTSRSLRARLRCRKPAAPGWKNHVRYKTPRVHLAARQRGGVAAPGSRSNRRSCTPRPPCGCAVQAKLPQQTATPALPDCGAGFACVAGYCRLAPLFLSNTANIGPSGKMLPWLLSDGAYKLAALPPSRNRALGQFSPSRNRRAKASNDTSP